MEPLFPQGQNEDFPRPPEVNMLNLDNLTAEELVKLAEENYETMNYDKCHILYEEAIRKEPENDKVLTSYGFFLSNIKEVDKAKDLLSRAIYANPNSHPKKYLYIAQLYEGNDSATFYMKAIEVLTSQGEILTQIGQDQYVENGEEYDINDIKKDMSQAYTALGELYMTDLALTEDAINICRNYLHKAVEINQTNIDAFYQLMNYYLEVDDPETAAKSAVSLMEVYKQAKESNNDDFFDEYPEETYLGSAKVLIELQKFSDALVILEDLFEDNSLNMEVLYLMTYCNFMLKNYLSCKELLEDFNQKQEQHCRDKEILAAKEELEESLKTKNVEEGNDWEDVSEEHMSNSEDMEVE